MNHPIQRFIALKKTSTQDWIVSRKNAQKRYGNSEKIKIKQHRNAQKRSETRRNAQKRAETKNETLRNKHMAKKVDTLFVVWRVVIFPLNFQNARHLHRRCLLSSRHITFHSTFLSVLKHHMLVKFFIHFFFLWDPAETQCMLNPSFTMSFLYAWFQYVHISHAGWKIKEEWNMQ